MALDQDVVLFGGYTPEMGGRSEGILAARRDPATGRLDLLDAVAATPAPSFLVRHPRLPVVYAVNEVSDGRVSAWAQGAAGGLTPLGDRSTGGDSPCHLTVLPDGSHLVSANYGDGSVAVHPLDPAGRLGDRSDLLAHHGSGADPQRQSGPHVHMVSADPRGGPLLAVDLGTDSIYPYQLDRATGRLVPSGPRVQLLPGTGPRHLARHPDGRRYYVVGELSPTMYVYERDDRGALHERGRVPTSRREGRAQPSEVAVHLDARFLYVANRGVDTVSVFGLEAELPRLVAEVDCAGVWPRHFAFMGPHLYVANERSHTVGIFRVDETDGTLAEVGVADVPSPTCVLPPVGSEM
ncbi:MAG TPA: lactonase family protein [Micromonosporaceae bacterium]